MHRINLRGPWRLSLFSQDEHVAGPILSRSFNAPTNLGRDVSRVLLALSVAQPPVQVLLNDHLLAVFPKVENNPGEQQEVAAGSESISIQRYDVKSTLLLHNKLAIHWQSMSPSCIETDTRTVRLLTADTNRWLIDAWLEIIES